MCCVIFFLTIHLITYNIGAIPLDNDAFRSGEIAPGVTNISCSGSEQKISECTFEKHTGDCETAGIVCQSELY